MKKIKNALISVLLFSFVFLVMHDFAIAELDTCNHYDTSSTQTHLLTSKSNLDIVDDIHESIHTMMAIDVDNTSYIPSFMTTMKPNQRIYGISFYNNFVLERPPLS